MSIEQAVNDLAQAVRNLDARLRRIENAERLFKTVTLPEVAAPGAPSANKVVVYADDNGVGKTRLMARFPSGTAQQIAIEP